MKYPRLFKNRYDNLRGKDWIRRVDPDDRRAFVRIGQECHDYGRQGGAARAKNATRNEKGQFKCVNTQ